MSPDSSSNHDTRGPENGHGQVDVTPRRPGVISRRRATVETARQDRVQVARRMSRGMSRLAIALELDMPLGTVRGHMSRIRRESQWAINQGGMAEIVAINAANRLAEVSQLAMDRAQAGDEQSPAYLDRVIASERVLLDKLGPVREQAGTGSVSLIFQGQVPAPVQPEIGQVIEGQVRQIPEETETKEETE